MIQRILGEEGIPQELIHLAQAESGFIPRAMSRKAAGGMWQFLKWRGQEYGLQQTAYTDERMDPEKATRAAAKHLHDLYNEFGDWYLAIAAYNCGPGVVEKAVERTGYADFWELRARGVLPIETTNYVPIILAMTIMEKNAAEYGLQNLQMDPPVEYDTVETSAPTSLLLVSDLTDTPAPELAEINPAVLHGVTPAKYSLHVPKGSGAQLSAALERIPAMHRDSWRAHRVGAGETLALLGKRYGITPAALAAANNLSGQETAEGDLLVLPVVQRAPATRAVSRTGQRTTAQASSKHGASSSRAQAAASGRSKAKATRRAAGAVKSARHPAAIVASTATR
jgi:membrane-bound lytic murein transglycosylase D